MGGSVDAIDATELAVKAHELGLAVGAPVLQLSGVSRAGVTDVLRAVVAEVEKRDASEKAKKDEELENVDEETGLWRP